MTRWYSIMLVALACGLALMLPYMAMASDTPADPISVLTQATDSDPPDFLGLIDQAAAIQPKNHAQPYDQSTLIDIADPVAGEYTQATDHGAAGLAYTLTMNRPRSPILTMMEVDGFGQCMKPGRNHIPPNTT